MFEFVLLLILFKALPLWKEKKVQILSAEAQFSANNVAQPVEWDIYALSVHLDSFLTRTFQILARSFLWLEHFPRDWKWKSGAINWS